MSRKTRTSFYVRTRGGRVVHRSTCRYARSASAVPWLCGPSWGGKPLGWWVLVLNIHECRVCLPLRPPPDGAD